MVAPQTKGNTSTKRKNTLKKQKSRRKQSSSSSSSDSGSDKDSDKYRDFFGAMDRSRKSGDGSKMFGALPSFGGAGASPAL